MEYHDKTCENKIIHLVIQVLPVRRINLASDIVPLKKVTIQQVSLKAIGMVHGQVDIVRRRKGTEGVEEDEEVIDEIEEEDGRKEED